MPKAARPKKALGLTPKAWYCNGLKTNFFPYGPAPPPTRKSGVSRAVKPGHFGSHTFFCFLFFPRKMLQPIRPPLSGLDWKARDKRAAHERPAI